MEPIMKFIEAQNNAPNMTFIIPNISESQNGVNPKKTDL